MAIDYNVVLISLHCSRGRLKSTGLRPGAKSRSRIVRIFRSIRGCDAAGACVVLS